MARPGMAPGGQLAGPRKLDPDQMPSPIQVMSDDQANRAGQFVTNLKGQVPPLTTTRFTVVDQGNASPRMLRSSIYNVPISPDMLKQTGIPLALSIAPLAELPEGELPPPVVDLGELGPVRCIRCKAYMCPFMTFIDGGRRFSCPFCKANTDVPQEYFQHLDHTGQRLDKYDRPELCMGAYEFVCTKEYCRNNEIPKPPAYIFIIDVSYNNVKSGLVHLLCNNMKEVLRQLPVDVGQAATAMKVGFITYSNVVHFFNVKACLAQPQMLVVGDVQDMFVPLVDGLLVDASEAEAVIDSLMEQLPAMFAQTRETEVVLGPAVQAGMEALKAANCSGRLFVFHSSLPTGQAPGQLKNRDDRKVLGSDKEKHVLTPQTQFYNNLGQECVQVGCSVHLFLLNNAYVDLPTLGQVVRLTGGEVFKYTYFQADLDGDRLLRDLSRAVGQPAGFDAIMRVRTSTGVRPVDFHGHFYMSNTTDMELAAIDSSQAVTVELKHDDKLTEEDGVYIQAALLYTASSGQRRLRVLNLSLNVCSQMADLYRSCELDTITNLMVKQAVSKVLDSSPRAIRDSLTAQCAQILASYRKNCASPSSAGQLILPECMKLLPLYANCILRSDAVGGGPELTIDERSNHMYLVTSLPVRRSVPYLYPRLLPLDGLDPDATALPAPVRCSQDKLHDAGLFVLDNGVHLFLWVGLQLAPDVVQDLFAVQSVAQIDVDRPSLPELDTPLSIRVRGIVEEVRTERQCHMKLTVVRQRDKLEMVMRHFLVEDKGSDGSASYVDYLCHLHKEIRALLT
ncbi:protein transport protein Sec24C-like [Pollicipes pollicipes]|uniref:protein transport protein Sec24C-like n=1 Tax=Pollicipes pollicipes TaxID=41117 RepID=UPI0018852863|nr:protein transport protein Sec24C-like [Pollicipes pollicipes]